MSDRKGSSPTGKYSYQQSLRLSEMDSALSEVTSIRDQVTRELVRRIARMQDDEVRRMLGCWVSELEPELVYSGGRLVGLAERGTARTVVLAQPQRMVVTCGERELFSFSVLGPELES